MNTTTLINTTSYDSGMKKQFLSSVITGQVAGLIMAVAVMGVFALVFGKNLLYPVQVIGSVILGESALDGFNPLAVLIGLILHQGGPSLLWGAVYGFVASKVDLTQTTHALFAGLLLGIISMVGPYFLIPLVFNILQGVDIWNREVPLFWDWVAHLVFGASFIFYPLIQRVVNRIN